LHLPPDHKGAGVLRRDDPWVWDVSKEAAIADSGDRFCVATYGRVGAAAIDCLLWREEIHPTHIFGWGLSFRISATQMARPKPLCGRCRHAHVLQVQAPFAR
jgi:hypothetical protein